MDKSRGQFEEWFNYTYEPRATFHENLMNTIYMEQLLDVW